MTVTAPRDANSAQILAHMAAAMAHIGANRLVDAAAQYHACLRHPALARFPAARAEVLANYGTVLLQRARLIADTGDSERRLDLAIAMLVQARIGSLLTNDSHLRTIIDSNLALAYLERDRVAGRHADLISAQLALDRAEAATDQADSDLHPWIQSIRDTVSKRMEHQRHPR